MDSDDDFFGGGPSKIKPPISKKPASPPRRAPSPPPRNFREYSPPIDPQPRKSQESEEEPEDEDNDEEISQGEQNTEEDSVTGSGSQSGSQSGSESVKTEDDPLSDLWDSDDNDRDSLESEQISEDDIDDVVAGHEFGHIRTPKGMEKVDLTPPNQLLNEAELFRRKYYRRKLPDKCIRECVRCLALTRVVYHEKCPFKLASCHAWLGKAYYELRDWPAQTLDHCEQALKFLLKSQPDKVTPVDLSTSLPTSIAIPAPSRADILDKALLIYSLLGRAQLAMKKIQEAETNFIKAQTILKERINVQDDEKPLKDKYYWKNELTTAMARVRMKQGNFDEAYRNTKQSLKLVERRFGEHSQKLIPILKELTKIQQKRNELDKAAEFAMKAYSIAKADFPETDIKLADTVKFLAQAYAKIIGSDQADFYAESYFREAIADYEASTAEGDKHIINTYKALAEHFAATKRHQDSVTLITENMAKFQESYGELSLKTVDILKLLASQYLQLGDMADAAKSLRKAFDVEKRILGAQNQRTETTRKALDVLLKNPGLKHLNENEKQKNKPTFKSAVRITTAIL